MLARSEIAAETGGPAHTSKSTARRRYPQLAAMAMAAALPICVFIGIVAYVLADSRRESALAAARDTAAQLAQRVSAELSGQQQALQTLAFSTALDGPDKPDLNAFYVEAARVKLAHPLWETIELVDLAGNQLMNLLRPVGQTLGKTADQESLAEVIGTGRPVVGGIGPVGTISGRRLIAVRVPVMRSDHVRYVLSTLLEPSGVLSLLRYAGAPKDWVGAVVDARGIVIASTTTDRLEVGQPASRAVLDAVARAPSGSYSSSTASGVRVQTVYQSVPEVGWTVHFGVSRETLDAPVSRSLGVLALGGFASLGLAAGLALLTARDLSQRRRDDAMRSQLELLASEERGQVAVDAAELGAWRWNSAADALTGSERFKRMLGLDQADPLRLQSLIETVVAFDRARVEWAIRRSIEDEEPIEVEFQTAPPQGAAAPDQADRPRAAHRIGPERLWGDRGRHPGPGGRTREVPPAAPARGRPGAGAASDLARAARPGGADRHRPVAGAEEPGARARRPRGDAAARAMAAGPHLLDRPRDPPRRIGPEADRAGRHGPAGRADAYAQDWQQRTSIKLLVRHGGSAEGLNEDVAIAAYRIALEALNNVAKHSRASQVSLLRR